MNKRGTKNLPSLIICPNCGRQKGERGHANTGLCAACREYKRMDVGKPLRVTQSEMRIAQERRISEYYAKNHKVRMA